MNLVLGRFLQALRAAEVRVSSSEGMDAARVFGVLGLADRGLLKRGLGQVLAKSGEDKHRFAECFEQFFTSEDFAALGAGTAPDDATTQRAAAPVAVPEPLPGNDDLEQLLLAGDRAALQLALAQAADQARVHEIRLFTQRGLYARRMLEAMGIVATEQQLAALRSAGNVAAAERLQQGLSALREEALAHVERQIVLLTARAGIRLREEILREIPLSRAEYHDFALMQRLVRKLARRLVALHSRRRKVDTRGALDVRRTLRRNLHHDGLLFEVVWRQRRVDRPRVVVVCDVSGSVAQVARFLLLFVYSVAEILPAVRAFVFSAELAEVSALFSQLPVEDAIATALQRHGWGSTDYGRALTQLCEQTLTHLDRRTTVLILGDGRSNHGDPGHRALHRIQERAGRVIWLNPEPRIFWNTGDSEMQRLAAACDRVESCRSLRQLENIIHSLLRQRV